MPKPLRVSPTDSSASRDIQAPRTKGRRSFNVAAKQRILRAADACAHGELGAMLRKEGVYHSQLAVWRRQLADSGSAHQHSGLNGHIPADVFYGRAVATTAIKQAALDDVYRHHPERFVNGAPRAKAPPQVVSINPLPASVISLPTAPRNNVIQKASAQVDAVPSTLLAAQPTAAKPQLYDVPKTTLNY